MTAEAFQSHAGSIEADGRAAVGKGIQPVFQSHAGSIEAASFGRWGTIDAWFQSHAGSIEAGGGYRNILGIKDGFNPTLVRLRPALSTLRLNGGIRKFQSHAGSIEARTDQPDPGVGSDVSIPRWFD